MVALTNSLCPSTLPLYIAEQTEYLGDAILDYIETNFLYYYLPRATPGDLTLWRQRLSKRVTQATIAYHFGLHKAMCYESAVLFTVCVGGCRRERQTVWTTLGLIGSWKIITILSPLI